MTRKNIRQTKRRRKYKLNSNKTMSEYDYIIDVLNSLFKQRFDIIKSIHDSTIINIDKEDYEDYKNTIKSLKDKYIKIFDDIKPNENDGSGPITGDEKIGVSLFHARLSIIVPAQSDIKVKAGQRILAGDTVLASLSAPQR